MTTSGNEEAVRSQSASEADNVSAAVNRSEQQKSAAPESAGFDKKLDGPNRPST